MRPCFSSLYPWYRFFVGNSANPASHLAAGVKAPGFSVRGAIGNGSGAVGATGGISFQEKVHIWVEEELSHREPSNQEKAHTWAEELFPAAFLSLPAGPYPSERAFLCLSG